MALHPTRKSAIRERLSFYRELGIGPLYRREVAASPDGQSEPTLSPAEADDKGGAPHLMPEHSEVKRPSQAKPAWVGHPAEQDQAAQEAYLATGDNREAKLRVILDDIGPNCERCKLARLGRKQIVFGTGDPHAELMFIGEGPGADEDAQGLPFVGRAGQLLNNMISAMGLRREQVYIANIVKCRPPGNRTPERDECETCSPFLMRQIWVVRPKVIVALGATAAKNLLAMNDSMASLRGRFYDFSPPRTTPTLSPDTGDKGGASADVDERFDCKLAVTYHPAFLLRDPRQKAETWKDLQMVMKELGLKAPEKATKDSHG